MGKCGKEAGCEGTAACRNPRSQAGLRFLASAALIRLCQSVVPPEEEATGSNPVGRVLEPEPNSGHVGWHSSGQTPNVFRTCKGDAILDGDHRLALIGVDDVLVVANRHLNRVAVVGGVVDVGPTRRDT